MYQISAEGYIHTQVCKIYPTCYPISVEIFRHVGKKLRNVIQMTQMLTKYCRFVDGTVDLRAKFVDIHKIFLNIVHFWADCRLL